jgi:signal recognition particle subunit SRP54
MFDSITKGLSGALSGIFRGKISEGNIRDAMREVRRALLEADVSYEIVEDFVKRVTAESVGEKVLKSLQPGEQIVGIVYNELVNLMGPVDHSLHFRKSGVSVLMMCGLQGSGKTTTCGKLARMLKEEGRRPLLVAADLQRPAAIEQLKVLGQQIGVPVYAEAPQGNSALNVCQNAMAHAKREGNIDLVILDTAGRLHIDSDLMQELEQIDRKLMPDQVLLVCDSMTGQDAVKSAAAFNKALELDGVILTKLDGDTRGGAALSVKAVTGVPIKFIGVGEQVDKLEQFHPERMASRILNMGDVVSLFEKAQREFSEEEMQKQQEKLLKGKFTLEDFQKQMKMIKRLGSLTELVKMIPGMSQFAEMLVNQNPEAHLQKVDSMISSMTVAERRNPDLIDRSRRNRIAMGSGTDANDVSNLLKEFGTMSKMMQKMSGMNLRDRMSATQDLASGNMFGPQGNLQDKKSRSKRGPENLADLEEKKKKQRKEAKKAKKRNRK